jgi:hypothetical protein
LQPVDQSHPRLDGSNEQGAPFRVRVYDNNKIRQKASCSLVVSYSLDIVAISSASTRMQRKTFVRGNPLLEPRLQHRKYQHVPHTRRVELVFGCTLEKACMRARLGLALM